MQTLNKITDFISKYLKYFVIGGILAFTLLGWIKSCSVENSLKKANKTISELSAQNDKLVKENKEKMAEYKMAMYVMDSLFTKSKISHETEIHNYWNTVYNGLVVSDTSYQFISNYLTELGSYRYE